MLRFPAILTILVSAAAAQPDPGRRAFEVASIRPSAPRGGRIEGMHGFGANIQVGPGSVTMRAVSLRTCIRWAWHVLEPQVTGPEWIGEDRYDVAAKAPGTATEDDLRQMMQALLAERFKLAVHRQSKETAAWILSVGKGGPKFQESDGEGESSIAPNPQKMEVAIARTQVSQLVDLLTTVLRAPVIDETGLKGRYDITLRLDKYIPDPGAPVDIVSTILTGIQQELGLRLEQRKVPLDLVVIDGVERAPVEN
jgi:uncharacterized protein (TIGR03435 family)